MVEKKLLKKVDFFCVVIMICMYIVQSIKIIMVRIKFEKMFSAIY